MIDKDYIKKLQSKYILLSKSINHKVKNKEELTDVELLYYLHFVEVAPVLNKIKNKEQN